MLFIDSVIMTNVADFAEYSRLELRPERVIHETKQPTKTHVHTHGEPIKQSNVACHYNVTIKAWFHVKIKLFESILGCFFVLF